VSGEVNIVLPNGVSLPLVQALAVADKIELAKASGHCHWHVNECRCCVTVHGADFAWVIGADGGADFFAGKGCDCGPEIEGQTT